MEETKNNEYGPILWVPFFWLFLASSRGRLSTVRTAFSGEDATVLFPIAYAILIVIGIIALYRRHIFRKEIFRNNPWIIMLFLFMGLSILWSEVPFISFKRVVKTWGVLVMVLIIMSETDPLTALTKVIRRLTLVAVPISLILCLFVPEYGRQDLGDGQVVWAGIATSKNSLAQVALMCTAFYTWLMLQKSRPKRPRLDPVLFILSLVLLVGSRSITCLLAYGVFLFVMVLIHFFRKEQRRTGAVLAYLLVLAGISYFVVDGLLLDLSLGDAVMGVFHRDATLTGRTVLWVDAIREGMERPLLGYGYGAFWLEDRLLEGLWFKHDWRPTDAHNGFVDVFLQLGFIGFVLICLIILRAYRDISVGFSSDFEMSRIRLLIFTVVIVHNFSETSICYLNHPFWFLFLFAAMRPIPLYQFTDSGQG